jgi:acetyltransferase-like isoleucine patch superfamily enzyme
MTTGSERALPWDWYSGSIPHNAHVDPTAFISTSFSFSRYRSDAPVGLTIGRGASASAGTMFDVGLDGRVSVGEYALLNGVWIICDAAVEIGDYTLMAWNVVLMDSYRVPLDPIERRRVLQDLPGLSGRRAGADVPARPVCIGRNVWVGFGACVLPGVTIGDGSIVGARSVVADDVAPYTLVAGNPARAIGGLAPEKDPNSG